MKKIQRQYIIAERGQETAVVMPLKEYEELLEDLYDIAIIAERKDESTVPFEKILKRLKSDGRL